MKILVLLWCNWLAIPLANGQYEPGLQKAAGSADERATEQAAEASVLPMENTTSPSLRDVSLEQRCDALQEFLNRFAIRYLAGLELTYATCAEGSGVGGTTYSVEFIISSVASDLSYRLDIMYRDDKTPVIKLCDTNDAPTACSVNAPTDPLRFKPGSNRFKSEKEAELAAEQFNELHDKTAALLPTLASWAGGSQTQLLIFGEDYLTFVDSLAKGQPSLPVTKADRIAAIPVALQPSRANPLIGTMDFPKGLNADLATCLGCTTVPECNTRRIVYKFEDRLLRIAAQASGAQQIDPTHSGASFNSGWIMSGKQPIPASGRPWQFSCNLTRYSLQEFHH